MASSGVKIQQDRWGLMLRPSPWEPPRGPIGLRIPTDLRPEGVSAVLSERRIHARPRSVAIEISTWNRITAVVAYVDIRDLREGELDSPELGA